MHLTLDIGNTNLKFAAFADQRIIERGSGIDTLTQFITSHPSQITKAMMASVADSVAAIDLLRKFNIPLTVLTHQTPLPIRNLYSTPETLGPDRIAVAVAADCLFNSAPALVISTGTCITYNVIIEGAFLGGAISPGITMRFHAMNHFTNKLPYIDWSPYQDSVYSVLVGNDSHDSMVCGVLNGVIQEVVGTIEQYRQRYSGLRVAVTGGDMAFLVKNLKNDIFARPDMVLEGLNHILLHHAQIF